jgi:hypothetical protein
MMGVDPESAGIGSFQRTFSAPVAVHLIGRFFSVLMPLCAGPRQCGQFSAPRPGAPSSRTKVVSSIWLRIKLTP